MLDWLKETEMAKRLETAIARVIAEGKVRTYDMGGKDSTLERCEGDCGLRRLISYWGVSWSSALPRRSQWERMNVCGPRRRTLDGRDPTEKKAISMRESLEQKRKRVRKIHARNLCDGPAL